jgi:type I restriction enzyme S subunit
MFAFHYQNLYRMGGASSTIAHLPEVQLQALPLPLPKRTEQDEICEIIAAVDGKIKVHECKRNLLEGLFRTLLHQLMTGQTRVNELDFDAFEAKTVIGE